MNKTNIKTNINYDSNYKNLLVKAKSVKISNQDILLDISNRLINHYGISEDFIKYIYKYGYLEGNKSRGK